MKEYVLDIPQAAVRYPHPLPERQHLLVIGGRPPSIGWLREAAEGRILWAVDHGVDVCRRADLPPRYLLGDRDSADKSAWEWGASHATFVDVYPTEKDLTDTQLALEKLPKDSFALVTGAFGGRFDHAFSNIFSCANAGSCCLADEQEVLLYLKGPMTLHVTFRQIPEVISLLPLSGECSGVSIEGVRWPLGGAQLSGTCPCAISNRPEKKEFPVTLGRGILGVYFHYAE